MTLLSAAATLLLILDPFGNLPLFHGILGGIPAERRRPILRREILVAYGILMFFLFVGTPLLTFLGLEQSSLSLAGGILLFLIAIGMVFPRTGVHAAADPDDEPFIVPLATPLIAGPSGIAFILLLVSREPSRLLEWAIAVTLASAISAGILLSGDRVVRRLGPRGMRAVERLMGMLLILIAVQMVMNGLSLYLATLRAQHG